MRRALIACLSLFAVLAFAWLAWPPAAAIAQGAPAYKNLKVLPPAISKADLKAVMKAQAQALGIDCDGCHDTDDFAKDTDMKKTARGMMQMTAGINKTYFDGKDVVTCATCHRGQKKPEVLGPGAK